MEMSLSMPMALSKVTSLYESISEDLNKPEYSLELESRELTEEEKKAERIITLLKNDNVCETFNKDSDMFEFLRIMNETDDWKTAQMGTFSLKYIPPVRPEQMEDELDIISSLYNFVPNDETLVTNLLINGGFVLSTSIGDVIISTHGMKTLQDRARNNAAIAKLMTPSDLSKMLNMSWPYMARNESKFCIRGNKGIAFHSAQYVPLPQVDLFNAMLEGLEQEYHDYLFIGGSYEHEITFASWAITGKAKDEIMKTYLDAARRNGFKISSLDNICPVIQMATCDVATYQATMYAALNVNGKIYKLGKNLTVKHHADATVEKFAEQFSKTFAMLKAGVDGISSLMDTEISYPKQTIVRVAKELKLPLKAAKEAVYVFNMTVGNTCTAYEIYTGLSEILYSSKTEDLSGRSRLNLEEILARMFSINWSKFDGPGDIEWE